MLGLFLLELLSVRDPSFDELWELIGRHHADGVEIEITAILARRLRMKDVSSLHTKLTLQNVRDHRFIKVGCAQCLFQPRDELVVGEMTDRKQVLLHPDGIPNAEALFSRQRGYGGVLGNPIRSR